MKQSIVGAAYDYATEKTKFRKDVLKEVDADNYVARHSDSMEDFQCGAGWQAKQSPWISVNERLPNENEIVLCRMKSMEPLLVDIFLYLLKDMPVYLRPQILNLKIMAVMNVICGCLSRSLSYEKNGKEQR